MIRVGIAANLVYVEIVNFIIKINKQLLRLLGI